MPRYTVNKRYSAMYNATRLDYSPPAEVDLPEAQADWVNRDCPGTLTLIEPEPELVVAAETEPGEGDADTGEAADETEKPARNRAHTPAKKRA